jgi:hypothetical protein
MTWRLTDDVEIFRARVGPLMAVDPAVHTIGLTVIETALARGPDAPNPDTYGLWLEPDGTVTGGFSITPPHSVLLEVVPDAALRPLIDALGDRLTGVNAPEATATRMASAWADVRGGGASVTMRTRLFRLGRLVPADPAPDGYGRAASSGDLDLLVSWMHAFHDEIPGPGPGEDLEGLVARRIEADAFRLWCTPGGTPTSMAGISLPAAGAVRLGPVYTPPGLRGHGYASGVTAVAAAEAQTRADHVVLFTDLANPTSNALYPRLGFRPVTDRVTYRFES